MRHLSSYYSIVITQYIVPLMLVGCRLLPVCVATCWMFVVCLVFFFVVPSCIPLYFRLVFVFRFSFFFFLSSIILCFTAKSLVCCDAHFFY